MIGCSLSGSRGNAILEGLTVLVVAAVFAIAGLYAYQVFTELNDDLQADEDLSSTSKNTAGNLAGLFPSWYDSIFLFMFVLFVIFVLVSVFFVDQHPFMFGVAILLLLGLFVAALFIGNAYHDVASDETINTFANDMPYMSWLMRHIAETIIGISFMAGIALFLKIKML